MESPDSIKETNVDGKRTLVFIKQFDKYNSVIVQLSESDGKVLLHKSFFSPKKEPYAKLPSIRPSDMSSVGGVSTISPAETAAISLESRDDEANVQQNFVIRNSDSSKVVDANGEPLVEDIGEFPCRQHHQRPRHPLSHSRKRE